MKTLELPHYYHNQAYLELRTQDNNLKKLLFNKIKHKRKQ